MLRRMFGVAFAALAIALPSRGQDTAAFERHRGAAPWSVWLDGPVEVPLLLLGREPRVLPVVEVYLNGKGPFRFGIETGAQFVGIRPGLADSLGLRRTGGPDEYPQYELGTVRIGAAEFEGLTVTALRTAASDIDGFLGFPFWQDILLTVDYPGRRVRIERGALGAPNNHDILPLVPVNNGDFLGVELRIGDASTVGIVDTRSTGAFGLTPEAAAEVDFEGELRVVGRASGAAIPETEVRAGKLAHDVKLGGHTIAQPTVGVRALPPHFPREMVIGTLVLQHFRMVLDMKNGRIGLMRTDTTAIEVPSVAPPQPAAASVTDPLAEYTGTWGDRTITLTDGVLHLQRPQGQVLPLVRIEPDVFGIEAIPAARYEFVRENGVLTALRARRPDGTWETVTRRQE